MLAQFGHILARTAGLLFMGVIVLNSEDDHTQGQSLGSRWRSCVDPGLVLPYLASERCGEIV